jgi:hypothetical protein
MSHWGIKLKSTGLNEKRLTKENDVLNQLQEKQQGLKNMSQENYVKKNIFDDRQGSLAADAMYGQQDRYNNGGKRRKSRKTRKSKKTKKTRKSRKSRK